MDCRLLRQQNMAGLSQYSEDLAYHNGEIDQEKPGRKCQASGAGAFVKGPRSLKAQLLAL